MKFLGNKYVGGATKGRAVDQMLIDKNLASGAAANMARPWCTTHTPEQLCQYLGHGPDGASPTGSDRSESDDDMKKMKMAGSATGHRVGREEAQRFLSQKFGVGIDESFIEDTWTQACQPPRNVADTHAAQPVCSVAARNHCAGSKLYYSASPECTVAPSSVPDAGAAMALGLQERLAHDEEIDLARLMIIFSEEFNITIDADQANAVRIGQPEPTPCTNSQMTRARVLCSRPVPQAPLGSLKARA